MNKAEIINNIARVAKLTHSQAHASLCAFLKTATQVLKRGDKIKLVDFGTFTLNKRAMRTGRHPKDGSLITIPARKIVRFKASGKLLKIK